MKTWGSFRIGYAFLLGLLILSLFMLSKPQEAAAADLQLVIDGQYIADSPSPILQAGRTLVPVRLISERLGAAVAWHPETKTVTIDKGALHVKLWTDNRLVDYGSGASKYGLSDVPATIINGRTFVPLRLVGSALGVAVRWSEAEQTVFVDSETPGNSFNPFPAVHIKNIMPGQIINDTTELSAFIDGNPPAGAAEIKFLLLDPQTGKGPIVAQGTNLTGSYHWLPNTLFQGSYVLAAAVYNQKGQFLAGSVLPVKVAFTPEVKLTGIRQGQVVGSTVPFGADLNFVAEYVIYEIKNLDTGKSFITDESDPQGLYNWTPQWNDNGTASIQVTAYDANGQAHESKPETITVNVQKELQLKGVTPDMPVNKPVTLWFSRNFPVSKADYLLKDTVNGEETVLTPAPGQLGYSWFPGPELGGKWQITARVTDTSGKILYTDPVTVQVPSSPKLLLTSPGPNQVVTGTVKLQSSCNTTLDSIKYQLINPKTGEKRTIAEGSTSQDFSWTPGQKDSGNWQLQASAVTASGETVSSETIEFKVYLGTLFQSKPIIAKDRFLDFASQMALQTQTKTGMSAALQTAQAILETGWGQYVPVDKYSGQLSNNLFGIKGEGTAGSVISNTWEEYNGSTYRVDAAFRAYQDVSESWDDHKKLLFTSSRYEPFKTVMYNSTMGAWALRRAGYATDSQYPLKLIDIIKRYDLYLLDETGI